jgi:hypothetical protein
VFKESLERLCDRMCHISGWVFQKGDQRMGGVSGVGGESSESTRGSGLTLPVVEGAVAVAGVGFDGGVGPS